MRTWTRRGSGAQLRICSNLESYECQLIASMVLSTTELLTERDGSAPQDALAELTGIRTGHTTAPRDLTLGRLLPDFHRPDQDELWAVGTVVADLNGALRSLNEPQIIATKLAAGRVVLETLPDGGGDVALTADEAHEWLTALNDVRLALGAMLGISDDYQCPDPEDPHAGHFDVYQWLTVVQELLVEALMAP